MVNLWRSLSAFLSTSTNYTFRSGWVRCVYRYCMKDLGITFCKIDEFAWIRARISNIYLFEDVFLN